VTLRSSRVRQFTTSTSLHGRLARGVGWSFAGSVAAQGAALAASIPVARLLGPDSYGALGIIQSTLLMFAIFSGPTLGLTATRYIAEFRAKDPDRASRVIGFTTLVAIGGSAAVSLILYCGAEWIATNALSRPMLGNDVRMAAVALLLNGINGAQLGILAGFEAFRSIAQVNLVKGVATLPIMTAATLYGGLHGAVLSLAVVAAITVAFTEWGIVREYRRTGVAAHFRGALREWRIIVNFSVPALIGGIVAVVAMWMTNVLLVKRIHGYFEMGLFSVANQWRNVILFMPVLVNSVTLPLLSNVRGDLKSYDSMLKLNIKVVAALTGAAALLVSVLSPVIVRSYGAGFTHGKAVLVLMALACVPIGVNGVIGNSLAATGQMWWSTLFNVLWAVAFLLSGFALIRFGAVGLAGAYLIAYTLHLAWQSAFLIVHRQIIARSSAAGR
jgi:O-antigen/teichoic acid export membrane protein